MFQETQYGFQADISLDTDNHPPRIADEITDLSLNIYLETESRVRIKIEDSKDPNRFRVPISTPTIETASTILDYSIETTENPFGIIIKRKSTGTVIFNSTFGPLIFADQFLQVML